LLRSQQHASRDGDRRSNRLPTADPAADPAADHHLPPLPQGAGAHALELPCSCGRRSYR